MRQFIYTAITATALTLNAGLAFAAGAIAVDDEEGTKSSEVGYGTGYGSTREEAAAAALKECSSAGNSGCKVVVRFDTCGAYAASKGHYGTGYGSNKGAAEAKAMEECGAGCRIVVSDCDE